MNNLSTRNEFGQADLPQLNRGSLPRHHPGENGNGRHALDPDTVNSPAQTSDSQTTRWRERYDLIISSAGFAVYDIDLLTGEVFWSRGSEKALGFKPASLNRAGSDWLEQVRCEDREMVKRATEEVKTSGGSFDIRYQLGTGKKSDRWIEDHGQVVLGAGGQCIRVHGVIKDITEQKLLEAKFLRAQRLESLGALASGIAHDLNNVFTPILMSAQTLGDNLDAAARKNILGMLKTSALRGSEMVKQVLTFARGLETGVELVQLKHLLGEFERIMRDTFPPNIRIERNIDSELYPVRGDTTQLYQILMNLGVNARDAMPDGGVLRLEAINLKADGSRGPEVCLSVIDTGTGISPEAQRRIFEPFYTTKESGKGTGLGLSTVLSLVKAHAGRIEVESKQGVGSRFKIFLPAEPLPSSQPVPPSSASPGGRGELLLIVDDESVIRAILKSTLEAHDYKVLLAEEGTEALALYATNREKISLVMTDIAMPVLDGKATMRALRKMNPDVKVVIVSAESEPEKLAEFTQDGVAVLLKPFSPEKLLRTIHQTLNPPDQNPENWTV